MRKSLQFTFAAAIILYLLQAFTPLRLMSDSIGYLSLADAANHTGILKTWREPFPFPKGYPLFLFLLMKSGVFSSAAVVLANLVLFGVGLFLSFRTLVAIGFQRHVAHAACLLTLLSFAAVKYATQAMSDFLFFAIASAVCWLLTLDNPNKWIPVMLGTIAAIEVRVVGLALLAPVLVVAWPLLRRHRWLVTGFSCLVILFAAAGLTVGHRYWAGDFAYIVSVGFPEYVKRGVLAHSQGFGEVALNLPLSKLPHVALVPVLLTGAGFFVLLVRGVIAIRRQSIWLCCYLAAFGILVLVWPFTEPRFWLPIMPFLVVALAEGTGVLLAKPRMAWLPVAYAIVFCVVGFIDLAYSTRVTFSGSQFAYVYGDGNLASTYLANCDVANTSDQPVALHLLQRYEWHCAQARSSGGWSLRREATTHSTVHGAKNDDGLGNIPN